jgi:hypothetical protein
MTIREAMTAFGGVVTMGAAISASVIAWAVVAAPATVVAGLLHASDSHSLNLVVRALGETLMQVVHLF